MEQKIFDVMDNRKAQLEKILHIRVGGLIIDEYRILALFIYAGFIQNMLQDVYCLVAGIGNASLIIWRGYVLLRYFLGITAIAIIIHNRAKTLFAILTLYFLTLGVSACCTPDIIIILPKLMRDTMLEVIISACFISSVSQPQKLVEALSERLYIILGVCYSILEVIIFSKSHQYNMGFTHSTLLLIVLCVGKIWSGKRENIIPAGMMTLANLIAGARGGIVCYIAIILLLYVEYSKGRVKFSNIAIGSTLTLLLFTFRKAILGLLLKIAPDSRTLQLLSSDLMHLSNREKYYNYIVGEIVHSKFSFHGMYSDRIYLARYFEEDIAENSGSYAHNIFLEILFQFGWIGIVLIVCSAYILFRTGHRLKANGDKSEIILFSSAFSIGTVLLISSSYATSFMFGMPLGVVLLLKKMRTQQKGNRLVWQDCQIIDINC